MSSIPVQYADFLTTISKTCFDFLLHFWSVHEIENILKKKKSILA